MSQSNQQYTAATGVGQLTTGNKSLDGTGPITEILRAENNGTIIKTLTLKAAQSTEQGMIRFFIADGSGKNYLWKEIPTPANVQSPTTAAFQATIRTSFTLQPGDLLFAGTENSEVWNIIAEGVTSGRIVIAHSAQAIKEVA